LFYQTALQKKFLRIQRKLMSLGMLLYTELVRRGKFAFFVSALPTFWTLPHKSWLHLTAW